MVAALTALPLFAGAVPASAGGGCHGGFTDEATTAVQASENCFFPTVARVEVGDTVRWQSSDVMPHTVTGVAGSFGSVDQSKELTKGRQLSYTFNEPGVYPYACLLHPGMVGAIVVGDGLAAAGAGDTAQDVAAAPAASVDHTAATGAERPGTTTAINRDRHCSRSRPCRSYSRPAAASIAPPTRVSDTVRVR